MSSEIIQGYRLSPQQKRVWLLHAEQLLPSIIGCVIEISGKLDQVRLCQALEQVVKQHEILRTTFQLLPGMTIPVQVIAESGTGVPPVDVAEESLEENHVPYAEPGVDAVAGRHGRDARGTGDFTKLPLFRAELRRVSESNHQLLLSAPAVCLDGPSLHCLFRQIAAAYNSEPAFVESMQYADFAEWQNELLESSEGSAALQYWKQIDLSSIELPFSRPHQPVHTEVPVNLEVPAELAQQLAALAERNGVTLASLMLVCWQLLLLRSTGREDITVAVAFAGRQFPELKEALGPIESYLPTSVSLARDRRFSSLLQEWTMQISETERLQQFFAPEQLAQLAGLESLPALTFSFAFSELPDDIETDEVRFRFAGGYGSGEPYGLRLACQLSAQGSLNAALHYDPSLLAAEDVTRFGQRLTALLADVVSGSDKLAVDLSVLGAGERRALLVDFNDTRKAFPNQCIHELFEAQVQRTPDSVALVFEEEQVSFAELNARANRLAHRLRKLGVGPDAAVGLCLERSVDLIASLLGILKAGGAYVPLDPGLPAERLKSMLGDAGVRVLVTRADIAAVLAEESSAIAAIDPAELDAEGSADLVVNVHDQNLAYIIFTSGSTGRPKGVAVEHRQLANYVHAINERLEVRAGSSFATVSTIAADLGNTALFPSLLIGGTLHLIAEERATNPDAFADYCRSHPIDCLKIVPSHLAALLSAASPADLLPQKRLVLGGEASTWTLVDKISRLAPSCQVLNHYGPTETTVGATTFAVNANEKGSTQAVPLGHPIANAQAFILDERRELLPMGVAGELHISGAGVARGYLGRPEATAEKFVPNPFSTTPGERLYRTGDLARYLSDGRIEFLGRIDDQLKIHGYRIEPAEIEQVLRSHSDVNEAFVLAREDQPGDKRLIAYVVGSTDASALKSFLHEKLPEYMVPRAIVLLERLPLTRNGKIDRNALPQPELLHYDKGERAAPRNRTEETLAQIWSNVLGVRKLGIHDNFFELGGDSILSIQIIARANQAGLKLSPRQVFQHQTIAELAAVAGQVESTLADQGLVTGLVPLTPVQTRFLSQNQLEPHHYNQAKLLDVDERLELPVLKQAIEELVNHHDALRLKFEKSSTGWRQMIVGDAQAAAEVSEFDLAQLTKQTTRLHASLDLEQGPLVRVGLFTSPAQQSSKLLIVIHHLAVDAVSWPVLLEDLQTLYSELKRNRKPELPPKTTSFKRWSELVNAHAHSEAMLSESVYWLNAVESTFAPLPVDYEGGANTAASSATVTVALDPRETLALLLETPAAYRTQINEVLVTALAVTLSTWLNSPSVLLDLEGHGREDIFAGVDLTRTVGWFTSIFPVGFELQKADDVIDSLRVVKERLRAIPNRGIGYGLLRYASENAEIIAALNNQPQAQVRFNYLGQTDRVGSNSTLFQPAAESSGPAQSPATERGYLLNIIGAVRSGRLQWEWTYSQNIHTRDTIEHLAQNYLERLRTLITRARFADASGISPSDFPSARLSQTDLNKVLEKLRR